MIILAVSLTVSALQSILCRNGDRVIVKQYKVPKSVMGLHNTCFTFFKIITFYVDHSFYRHAKNLRKSIQRGRKLKANGSY